MINGKNRCHIVIDYDEHKGDNEYKTMCIDHIAKHLEQEIMEWMFKDFFSTDESRATSGRYALVVDAEFKIMKAVDGKWQATDEEDK